MKSHFANGEIPEHFGNGSNMAAGNEGSAGENDLQEDIERYLGRGGYSLVNGPPHKIYIPSPILLDFSPPSLG